MRVVMVVLLLAVSSLAFADRKPPPKPASIAVVVVIDRSKRMQGEPLEGAKDMVAAIADTLGDNDMVSVVAFDTAALAVVKLQRASNRIQIKAAVKKLAAGGFASYLPALVEAKRQLDRVTLRKKHVIMIAGNTSSPDGVDQQAKALRAAGITITAVGLLGADRSLLSTIADAGEGRLYMVEATTALPKIGVKELREAGNP